MGKAETVGKVGKTVEREREGTCWVSVAIGLLVLLLVLLLGTFLLVLFCGGAEKFSVQLFGLYEWQKYEALKFLGIGMGGGVLALQAVIANKRAEAMEKTAKAQADATGEQARANKNTEQGQRQERLKNAIEHLGNASDSVRLGGAYELFHLAEDTEDLGQRQTVLDILCAHIRWTTRERKYRGTSGGPEYIEYKEKYPSNPSEEIQSLLTLLFVQEHKVFVFTGRDIKLQRSWLNGSNLNQARLEKAHLEGTQLQGAYLIKARLQGAHLMQAQLHEAQLGVAQLQGAQLFEAQLQGAHLIKACLQGAELFGAQLQGAQLVGARLQGAELMGAQLQGAQLGVARLQGADLEKAQLQGAQLGKARLHGASSNMEYFYESFEASINKRIGQKSDLDGVIFAGGLTQEDVDCMCSGLSDGAANELQEKLREHIGESESYGVPEDSGTIRGTYTKEEAAQWIAEYKTALSAVSESG